MRLLGLKAAFSAGAVFVVCQPELSVDLIAIVAAMLFCLHPRSISGLPCRMRWHSRGNPTGDPYTSLYESVRLFLMDRAAYLLRQHVTFGVDTTLLLCHTSRFVIKRAAATDRASASTAPRCKATTALAIP